MRPFPAPGVYEPVESEVMEGGDAVPSVADCGRERLMQTLGGARRKPHEILQTTVFAQERDRRTDAYAYGDLQELAAVDHAGQADDHRQLDRLPPDRLHPGKHGLGVERELGRNVVGEPALFPQRLR